MTRLYLARHGETEWNLEKRLQGHLDSPLTKLGVLQANWLAAALNDVPLDVIYTSSSPRAYRTAESILQDRKVELIATDELKEMNLGDWEGRIAPELEREYPEQFRAYWNAPHLFKPLTGESYEDVRIRVATFLEAILPQHEGQNVLLVTHTVTLKMIMASYEQRPLSELWNPPYIHPASLSLIEWVNGDPRIVLHGDSSHYQTDLNTTT